MATVALAGGCDEAGRRGEPESVGIRLGVSSARTLFSDEELQVVGRHISPTVSAEFTTDGKWIVVSGTDGVTIHDATSMRCVNWFNGELIEVAPDGGSFLLRYPNGMPELRSIPSGTLIWRLPNDVVNKPIHYSDDGQYIVCGYRNLLRIENQEVIYQAPDSYTYDTFRSVDRYDNPADNPERDALEKDRLPGSLGKLPYIYRKMLRHDGRPLITPKSRQCSPAGQFMAVQTGEHETSFDPYYTFIHRTTGDRIFSDVTSLDALFFRGDEFVFFEGSVYRTRDKLKRYALANEITSFAMNVQETMLAIGWHNGEVAVLDPLSGDELFHTTIENHVDTRSQQSGRIVSLAFSNDSKRLAVVGRKLTIIDVSSKSVSDVVDLGGGSDTGIQETTSPAAVVFNADDSRLLLEAQQGAEYIYSRARLNVFHANDLSKGRALVSPDFFDRFQQLPPVYFNRDGTLAILAPTVSGSVSGAQAKRLQLWDTKADKHLAEISAHMFDWVYRQRFVVPEFPKRHLGLGRLRHWHPDEIVLAPWSWNSIEPDNEVVLPDHAKSWLNSLVRVNPQNTSRGINGETLDLPSKNWRLRFNNNRIRQLYDLSSGDVYPPSFDEHADQKTQQLDKVHFPETCWGLAGVDANAFSPDGSHLLVYPHRHQAENEHLLALYAMPSGKLIRAYEGHKNLKTIDIAPNGKVAAIATDFYRQTWIIDLGTGATLVELPEGGKCVFSTDGRYAQVGDRYGRSRSLLTIESGELVDFKWADRWAFSSNSRYAVGGSGRSWYFVDLASGERKEISGDVHRTGMRTPLTTELDLPHDGSRFLCVDGAEVELFDANTGAAIASHNLAALAKQIAKESGSTPTTYQPISNPMASPDFLYTPDGRDFAYVVEGSVSEDGAADFQRNGVLALKQAISQLNFHVFAERSVDRTTESFSDFEFWSCHLVRTFGAWRWGGIEASGLRLR